NHPRTAHVQVAEGLAVPRQLVALAIDDLPVDAEHDVALLLADVALLVLRELQVLALQLAKRAEGRHLRHAPRVVDLYAELLLERAHHRRRAGRAAHARALERRELLLALAHVLQEAEPDRRNAGGIRDALGLEELVQRLAVEGGAGEDELRAGER